jgi:hypothetical protein
MKCRDITAKFRMDDVRDVKADALNGEFFVAVFSNKVKDKAYKIYKIKQRRQEELGLK